MPGFDRSGPMGNGPMTGGNRGLCGRPPADLAVYGRGYAYGRGMDFRRGRGWGRGAAPAGGGYGSLPAGGFGYPVSKTDELDMLRSNADAIQRSLESIQARIADLEKEGLQ